MDFSRSLTQEFEPKIAPGRADFDSSTIDAAAEASRAKQKNPN
jgi:hypothetical protein